MWRETDAQYRAAAEAFVKVSTSKDVAVQTAEQRAPDFSQGKAECLLWSARVVHAGPAAVGGEDPGVHEVFPSVAGDSEFDRDVHGASRESVSGHQRGHAAAVWPGALPAGAVHPGQGFRRDGHQPVLQLRLDRSGGGPGRQGRAGAMRRPAKGAGGAGEGSLGRALCGTGDADRARRGRLFSRSVRPSRRGFPAEGHQRGADLCA